MSKRANMYGLHRVAAQFDAVEDRHIAFALAAGWTLDRAKREFARFESRRNRAMAGQDFTRGAPPGSHEAKLRRLGRGCPEWVIERAIRENWSIRVAAKAFLDALRKGC